MNTQMGVRQGFVYGAMLGLAFALLELFTFASGIGFRTLQFIKMPCYPASWAATQLDALLFTHNRIGPSRTEIIVFDVFLCIGSSLVWGAVGATVAAISRSRGAVL